jgi:hypothetical protein
MEVKNPVVGRIKLTHYPKSLPFDKLRVGPTQRQVGRSAA